MNKVAVITGASAGIGRALARVLARDGFRLWLVARREDRLREVEAEVKSLGGQAYIQTLDLREPLAAERMIGAAMEQLGRIDVLVNNAAFGYYGTVENTPPEVVREIFEINFEVPLRAAQCAIPVMRRQKGGHIINISSVAGKRGLPLSGIYSATKFALNGISESLRMELRKDNIHVSIVCPVSTRTEFFDVARRSDTPGAFKPIGPTQSAEQVAKAVAACIRNPRAEVFPYWPGRLVGWINAIAPSIVDAVTIRYWRRRSAAE